MIDFFTPIMEFITKNRDHEDGFYDFTQIGVLIKQLAYTIIIRNYRPFSLEITLYIGDIVSNTMCMDVEITIKKAIMRFWINIDHEPVGSNYLFDLTNPNSIEQINQTFTDLLKLNDI